MVDGRNRYYGAPINDSALHLWHRALSRRSQNGRIPWDRIYRIIPRWLPQVRNYHHYPLRRMGVVT